MINSAFINIKNIIKNCNGQSILLFIYSMIVTFAFVLVISKNFETPEQIDDQEKRAEYIKNENNKINSNIDVPEVYVTGSSETNHLVPDWEIEVEDNQTVIKKEIIEIKSGDNFISLMKLQGLSYAKALEGANRLKEIGFDVKNLRAGQNIDITKSIDEGLDETLSVDSIIIKPSVDKQYVLTLDENLNYIAEVEYLELKKITHNATGIINSSLAVAMQNQGIAQSIIGNFINIFAYTVDFRYDIKAGNTFKVLYERQVDDKGKIVKNGDILYAELQLNNNIISLYRYKDADGNIDYYDDKGVVLKRALDKKPLEYKSARISSRYGWRVHPILKTKKFHSGVDYAAPKGSRIYASGDGVIKRAQYVGGYGNYVVIRHNSEYSTAYGHMNSFAKGIRPGVRVKQGQVIGYVGSTGRSTGPHLHFEVIKDGKKIDPLKIKVATGENLNKKEFALFQKVIDNVQEELSKNSDDKQTVTN